MPLERLSVCMMTSPLPQRMGSLTRLPSTEQTITDVGLVIPTNAIVFSSTNRNVRLWA